MKKKDITIIICCAGMGTRLGIGSTKALIDIDGKPLIIHLLELLEDYDDIRLVVGYQAERVIDVVTKYRKDVMFTFNYDYETTGIVQSLKKALPYSRKYVVEIDGDMLISKKDFEKFIDYPEECIGLNKLNSENPIYANVCNNNVIEFSNKHGAFEFTGLVKIASSKLNCTEEYLYQSVSKLLPLPFIKVDTCDIDTYDDYERAIEWYNKKKEEKS